MTACPPTLLSPRHKTFLPSAIGHHCIDDSWLHSLLQTGNATITELYSTSAYFAIVTFMTVGFGDFSASNYIEVRISNQYSVVYSGGYRNTDFKPPPSPLVPVCTRKSRGAL